MKVLYIHQFFKSPKSPGGTRSYWLAQELIQNGYEVTMITTDKTQKEKVRECNIDGINVVYFHVPYNQSMGIKDRLLSFFRFVIYTTKYALKNCDKYDYIFATSTPLTVAIPALISKWLKGKKYIFEVRDLWPEVPIQMGGLKNPLVKMLARWLEKLTYRNAEHVFTLSPGMQEGVIKYISEDKTSMIPNMSKIKEFFPRKKDLELMSRIGLKVDCLKVIHFGSLGEANYIDPVIETAVLLKNHKVQFLFLGAGSTETRLKQLLKEKGISNVLFHERTPMALTSEIVNCCDISLVSFKDIPILYTNSPNKLFDSLSAGKPIIVNSAGWTKDLVEEKGCGFYYKPTNPQELANKLIALLDNQEELETMGQKSRQLAEQKYDKSILVKEFSTVFNRVTRINDV